MMSHANTVTFVFHTESGKFSTEEFVRKIAPKMQQCQYVRDLVPYLLECNFLNPTDREMLLKDPSGNELNKILYIASTERTRGRVLVEKLYLSLLDMFLDTGNTWCYDTAFYVVREEGEYINS